MFVIMQIPFVDKRLLSKTKSDSFLFPNERGQNNSAFYRHIGPKGFRNEFSSLPLSEHNFFGGKRLLKIEPNINYKYKIIFSRLYVDDFFLQFDIGIDIDTDSLREPINLLNLIKHLTQNDIFLAWKYIDKNGAKNYKNAQKVKSKEESAEIYKVETSFNFFSLQKHIESLYIYATTKTKEFKQAINENHLHFGAPAIFFQYTPYECSINNKHFTNIINEKNYSVNKTTHICTVNGSSFPVHLWFLSNYVTRGPTRDVLRRIRLCMLKLNCFREGLKGIFDYLDKSDSEFADVSDKVFIKFKNLKERLVGEEYYGVNGKEMMDLALKCEKDTHSSSWNENMSKIDFYLNAYSTIKERSKQVSTQIGVQVNGGKLNSKNIKVTFSNGSGGKDNIDDKGRKELIGEIEKLWEHFQDLKFDRTDERMENSVLTGNLVTMKQEVEKENGEKVTEILKEIGGKILGAAQTLACHVIIGLLTKGA